MSLRFKSEPREVAEVIRGGLERMASKQAFSTPSLSRIFSKVPARLPVPFKALPVYNLGLNDLAKGHDLRAAVQTGWRYLLKHSDKVVASVDAVVGPNQHPVFAQINEGPLVSGLISAINVAIAKDDFKRGEYEVRILMVPALYTAALWLVDVIRDRDMAIPISPTPPSLIPNKPIPANELLSVLRKAAKLALKMQPSAR